jgi:hypothetical protein
MMRWMGLLYAGVVTISDAVSLIKKLREVVIKIKSVFGKDTQ